MLFVSSVGIGYGYLICKKKLMTRQKVPYKYSVLNIIFHENEETVQSEYNVRFASENNRLTDYKKSL